jgi:UDP:flavonoid glycosyltransferase YjiC (YdhE family)
MRFLFCSLASHGFLYPTISIANTLRDQRHDVAFVTGSVFGETLRIAGFERIPNTDKDERSFQVGLWWDPGSIAQDIKHIEYALQHFAADALVGQHLTFGPLMVGEHRGLPVAILGPAAYLWPVSAPLIDGHPQSEAEARLVWRYGEMMKHYNQVRQLFQLPLCNHNYGETPLLGDAFLLQSVRELEENAGLLPARVHLVGACLWEPPESDAELNHWLKESQASSRPLIYVQPGRSFQDRGFWPYIVDALGCEPVRVAASIGRMDGEIGQIPGNFFVRNHVPQGLVLPYARAVISSGHTTSVLGALTHGVPCVLIPNGSGTEEIAERCQGAGVALCLPHSEISAEMLTWAVRRVLENSSMRRKAQSLQRAFARMSGPARAADVIQRLASVAETTRRF